MYRDTVYLGTALIKHRMLNKATRAKLALGSANDVLVCKDVVSAASNTIDSASVLADNGFQTALTLQ